MKQKEFEYIKNGVSYKVIVTYKHQKNLYFRYKNDAFFVNVPYLTSLSYVKKGLDKYFDKLIKIKEKKKIVHYSFEEDYVYILGEKVKFSSLVQTSDLEKYLFDLAERTIISEVRKYEKQMGITVPYKVKIKKTSSQFGSNSRKTHTLSFQLNLIHFSTKIIDSVVVHELAHEFERNHQKEFYNIVLKYCPDYWILHNKLRRGIHQ